jgi:hypothetical protein
MYGRYKMAGENGRREHHIVGIGHRRAQTQSTSPADTTDAARGQYTPRPEYETRIGQINSRTEPIQKRKPAAISFYF